MDHPWLIPGDFNQVVSVEEKLSKNNNIHGANQKVVFLNNYVLIDIKPCGNLFTWKNGMIGEDHS